MERCIMTKPAVVHADPRCWVVVASRAAVDAAVAGGYVEVSHGKAGPLERMRAGDALACYSPRATDDGGASVQAFTALGRVAAAPLYQAAHQHQPFRRAVEWVEATPAPVRPLIDALGFIRNKTHWGTAFRFGYLRVPPEDFALIASAMSPPSQAPASDGAAAAQQPCAQTGASVSA
jgi:hypothetical protein